jgi:hypothetical protein
MYRMDRTRHLGICAVSLLAAVALIFGAAAREGRGQKRKQPSKLPFEEARIYIEFNSTAQDAGIQVALDAEAWTNLRIIAPNGNKILDLSGKGSLRKLGLSEFFFESDEPALEDLPLDEFLAMFPEGEYKFLGTTPDGEKLFSTAVLSHQIPSGPVVVSPAIQDAGSTAIQWDPVTTPSGIAIASYEVVIEAEDRTFDVKLPGSATRVTIPPEFLEPGTQYAFEVLAKADNGNQTITESSFSTR